MTIGNFGTSWDGSICDEEHIAKALEDLGHEVIRGQREELEKLPALEGIDFMLIAQWDGYPESFALSWKYPKVYWAFDYQADGQEWHERLIKQSDLYLSKRIADSKYPNWQWLAQDFAPEFLDRVPIKQKDIDVLFTGSYLPWATERNETLKAIDDKYNLVIHSVNPWDGFKDVRPPIMDEGLPELYARAKIILSIDHTLEAGYWSDRNAQIMACGGFVMFRYVPLSPSTFHNHVHYFYSKEGCLEDIAHFLEADEDREAIALGGYEYAQNYLKVQDRVIEMLEIVASIL